MRRSEELDRLRLRIAELLAQADLETSAGEGRGTGGDPEQAAALQATTGKDVLENLVLQLRATNQKLVIATLNAQDMHAAAEAAYRQQEDFLAMLAHELRNPLAPLSMASDLLGKIQPAPPELSRLHAVIDRQLSHMRHLVDDLLDASRLRTGKITLQKRVLLFSEIIESAVETSQPFIDKRHHALILDLPIDLPHGPIVIDGDPVRLAQVFSNLLINAAKFTPEYGHIHVSVRRLSNAVQVSVKDDGIGIAAEIQPFIFDSFTQCSSALDRSQGGLGIGLALVRNLVTMHDGNVEVRSAGLGSGSEFIVVLPLSAETPPCDSSPESNRVPTEKGRILLIEDNIDGNETLCAMLALKGHTMSSAFDGMAGLAMAKENSYDVIICDVGLPGIDGYDVVKQLRLRSLLPMPCFIGISGYAQMESASSAAEAGFDHYLVKPFAAESLLDMVSICLSKE